MMFFFCLFFKNEKCNFCFTVSEKTIHRLFCVALQETKSHIFRIGQKVTENFRKQNETFIYTRSMKNCLQGLLVISETIFSFKIKKFCDRKKTNLSKKIRNAPTFEFKFDFFLIKKSGKCLM